MSDYKNDDLYTDDGIEFLDDIDSDDEDFDSGDEDFEDFFIEEPSKPSPKINHTNTGSKPTFYSELLSYVKIIIAAVIIAFILVQYVIVNAQVPTGSMKNTIMEGDKLIGFRLSYLFSDPQRGDIVIFKFPDDETENYVKRIIGIPGDVIEIKEGHVYINGELSNEDYIREDMIVTGLEQTFIVPANSYFMLGDNRNGSADSRVWKNTYVKKDKILAKVIFRYFDGENRKLNFSLIK